MRSTGDLARLVAVLGMVSVSGGCLVFDPPLATQDADARVDASSDADAADLDASEPSDAASDASVDAARDSAVDAGPASCVVPSIVTYDDCTGPIVINEVDGSGDDFIELYNRSDVAVNISNYLITDDNAGTPAVAEGVVFPIGTVLEAHRFIYVWSNLGAPQPGIRTTDCIPGSPPPCVHSGWGISAGGERVYLLDDTLAIVCSFQYPGSVFGSEAFGRVVDGTAMLCPSDPTPGETNLASTLR